MLYITVTPARTWTPVVNYTATTPVTWTSWNTQYITTAYGGTSTGTSAYYQPAPEWNHWNSQYQETAEQRAEREERQRETDRENARLTAEWRAQAGAAKERAEALLFSLLTDEQAASYREKGFFEVRGSKGGRWRIRSKGQSGNVDLMPEIGEEREASYCGSPPDVPSADAHLAQMLHLVTDEDSFKRVANVQYRRPARAAA